MNKEVSFHINLDGTPYPVRFEPEVLIEFQREYADQLDGELREVSDKWFGPTFFTERYNRLGVVAQLIRDAMRANDGVLVAKYALWMTARFPEIAGISINEDTYEFMADELLAEGLDKTVH